MAETMAIHGLQHKRARLAGKVASNQRSLQYCLRKISEHNERIRSLEADTEHIQAELSKIDRALDTAFNRTPTSVAQGKTPHLKRGQWGGVIKGCREVLRLSANPVTTNDIVLRVASMLDISLTEHRQWKQFRNSVRCTLRRLSDKGLVRRIHPMKTSEMGTWELARIPGK